MTRLICKLGGAAALVLGLGFIAAPAQAHEPYHHHHHHEPVIVVPRVVAPAYYPPPVVYAVPAPVVVRPVYPAYPYGPVYAPAPVVGASVRIGGVSLGIGIR